MESLSADIQPWIYVAAIDPDSDLRGKILRTEKIIKTIDATFGFPSMVLSGDIHDRLIPDERVFRNESSYGDIQAKIDPTSLRLMSWNKNKPFCLLSLFDSKRQAPALGCPRQLLQRMVERLEDQMGIKALCGIEFEIHLFKESHCNTSHTASKSNLVPYALDPRSYSFSELSHQQAFAKDLLAATESFNCKVHAFHTEMGPSVVEVALHHTESRRAADNGVLLPWLMTTIGAYHGVRPSFMAKPFPLSAGASGHIHLSLVDDSGRNVFAREVVDVHAQHAGTEHVSDMGRNFLAGVLLALPDITLMLCPNINSYKRIKHIAWAPASVSWGLENRLSAVRIIAPPSCTPENTRLEVRVPGSDVVPHYALAAIIGAGCRGIERRATIPIGPNEQGQLLPTRLRSAIERFESPDSIARQIFDNSFVDFYAATREDECVLFEEAVTDWEIERYL